MCRRGVWYIDNYLRKDCSFDELEGMRHELVVTYLKVEARKTTKPSVRAGLEHRPETDSFRAALAQYSQCIQLVLAAQNWFRQRDQAIVVQMSASGRKTLNIIKHLLLTRIAY
jgi:hypothetical protein